MYNSKDMYAGKVKPKCKLRKCRVVKQNKKKNTALSATVVDKHREHKATRQAKHQQRNLRLSLCDRILDSLRSHDVPKNRAENNKQQIVAFISAVRNLRSLCAKEIEREKERQRELVLEHLIAGTRRSAIAVANFSQFIAVIDYDSKHC